MISRLFSVALLAGLLASCGSGDDQKDHGTPEAGYVTLKTETIPLVTELAGRTSAYEVSDVRPQVSGVVKARLFSEGSFVRAGQTLYQIDPRVYEASVQEARANLASAQANFTAARQKADRYRPLATIEAVSKQDYADVQATANQAGAAVQQNRAQLDTARINLNFTRVPAPISGRIGRSNFTTGALVTASQAEALTTIQRLDPIFVDIQQSSTDLLALRRQIAAGSATRTAASVKLVLEDGSTYDREGVLEFNEVVVDPATGSVALRARFPNPDGLLLPGMYVRAILTQATVQNAILVPQAGLTRDPKGNATVLLVGKDNKAISQSVQADRTIGDKWLVTKGLKPGDRVIVEGLSRIKPGQPIKPVPVGSPSQKADGNANGGQTAPHK